MTYYGTHFAIPSPVFATGYDAPALPVTGYHDAKPYPDLCICYSA